MSLRSRLTRLGHSLALVVLLVAALLFLFFALSPSIELLPDGMDWLVGILLALFLAVWLFVPASKR